MDNTLVYDWTEPKFLKTIQMPFTVYYSQPYPEIPPDTCPLRYGSDLVLLHHSAAPASCDLSLPWQYGRQLESRSWGVPVIITWSLATAVIVMYHKSNNRKCSQLKNSQKRLYFCFFFWDLYAGVNAECFIWKSNRMPYCCYGAWPPVCFALNSAQLLHCAPASARKRSPAYLYRRALDCQS